MKLFNKSTILIFSIIGSTLFGALLFSDNLKQLDKRKHIASIIIFALVWNVMMMKLLKNITIPFVPFIITNLLGGIILIVPIWKYHIEEYQKSFVSRKIWGPLISLIVLYSVIIILYSLGLKP